MNFLKHLFYNLIFYFLCLLRYILSDFLSLHNAGPTMNKKGSQHKYDIQAIKNSLNNLRKETLLYTLAQSLNSILSITQSFFLLKFI